MGMATECSNGSCYDGSQFYWSDAQEARLWEDFTLPETGEKAMTAEYWWAMRPNFFPLNDANEMV